LTAILPADCQAELPQVERRLHHRRMLDGADDQMPFAFTAGGGDAEQGEVVGLGRAAGEHDLLWRRADQRRHLLSGVAHRFPSVLTPDMGRRGIAELRVQER